MKDNKPAKYKNLINTPIAIIGMSAIYPGANNKEEYWNNIINRVDSITDVPSSRWNIDDYYTPDPEIKDKTNCKRGGFLATINFNPMEFGIPPNTIEATDFSQLIALLAAKKVLADAGYSNLDNIDRNRIGVILGTSASKPLGLPLINRMQYPLISKILRSSGLSESNTEKIIEKIKSCYIEWQENSFPGLLSNIVSGRIAKCFNFGGISCVVDAACASSLSAIKMGISELLENRCDMILTGGVDTDNSIFAFMCFSETKALSKSNVIRPFDEKMDGTLISEGIGMIILKRLEDAQRDNDKIYSVIRGIGISSDGNSKSIYAPDLNGQRRALQNAYKTAQIPINSIGLIEAHGTGTQVGDITEFNGLHSFFKNGGSKKNSIALGTVKSQIGHTKAAAGVAGIIKTAFALHNKILPPTINIDKPHPKLHINDSPLYLNTEIRPWINSKKTPRRAGVNSFGFGGINFHIILEEYTGKKKKNGKYRNYINRINNHKNSIILQAETPEELLITCENILARISLNDKNEYKKIINISNSSHISISSARVGFLSGSPSELNENLLIIIKTLKEDLQRDYWIHPKGIYYRSKGMNLNGKIVVLFPGQGSQYSDMGKQLAIDFPVIQDLFTDMDNLFLKDYSYRLSDIVYPKTIFNELMEKEQKKKIDNTKHAQPAIGCLNMGFFKLLKQAGLKPDFLAGHSFGEYSALWASGVLTDRDYLYVIKEQGKIIEHLPYNNNGRNKTGMIAVKGNLTEIEKFAGDFKHISISNRNSNEQVVLGGYNNDLKLITDILTKNGNTVIPVNVSHAFHSHFIKKAEKPNKMLFEKVNLSQPKIPVFSNTTGTMYPDEKELIRDVLNRHLTNTVNFVSEIENIYNSGGFLFIECGPKNILTNFISNILKNKPHYAISLNPESKKDSTLQFQMAILQLRIIGLQLKDIFYSADKEEKNEIQKENKMNIELDAGINYSKKRNIKEIINDGFKIEISHNTIETNSYLSYINQQQMAMTKAHHILLENQNIYSRNMKLFEDKLVKENITDKKDFKNQIIKQIEEYSRNQNEMLKLHEKYFDYITNIDKSLIESMSFPPPDKIIAREKRTGTTISRDDSFELFPSEKDKANNTNTIITQISDEPQQLEENPPVSFVETEETDMDTETINEDLLHIISEKTGYPLEMLEIDMDIESDLGIDSIKIVEIANAIINKYEQLQEMSQEELLAELIEIHTLEDIAVFIKKRINAQDRNIVSEKSQHPGERPSVSFVESGDGNINININSYSVELQNLPYPDFYQFNADFTHIVLLTDDGTDTVNKISDLFVKDGYTVVILSFNDLRENTDSNIFWEKLEACNEESIKEKISSIIKKYGEIGIFIHLHPKGRRIKEFSDISIDWIQKEKALLKTVFFIAKYLTFSLNKSAENGFGSFFIITRVDGKLGISKEGDYNPLSSGLCGFIKSLNQEWEKVFCRIIDLAPTLNSIKSSQIVFSELHDTNRIYTEIGYYSNKRVTIKIAEHCISENNSVINSNSVFLVSGGGKGITAECVKEMANRYKCKFILLGRSTIDDKEPDWAKEKNEPLELKKCIILHLNKKGVKATPKEVDQIYNKIISARVINNTLLSIKKAGGNGQYISVDISDFKKLKKKLDMVKEINGKITGIIHGAGIISDKLIEKKSEEDFDRIFSVKINGLYNLLHNMDINEVKYLVLFSSTAGFFGNKGQTVYSLANEILNKSAYMLKAKFPGSLIVSINWGPWESGMVTPELKKIFEERKINIIPVESGVHKFIETLSLKNKEICQVITGMSLAESMNIDKSIRENNNKNR